MMTSDAIITRTLLRSHLDVVRRWILLPSLDAARRSFRRAMIELWRMDATSECTLLLRERMDRIGRYLEDGGEEELRLAVGEIENALSEMESRRPGPADRNPVRVTED